MQSVRSSQSGCHPPKSISGHEAGAVFRRTLTGFDVVELGEEPADEDTQSYRGAGEAAAFPEVFARPEMWWECKAELPRGDGEVCYDGGE